MPASICRPRDVPHAPSASDGSALHALVHTQAGCPEPGQAPKQQLLGHRWSTIGYPQRGHLACRWWLRCLLRSLAFGTPAQSAWLRRSGCARYGDQAQVWTACFRILHRGNMAPVTSSCVASDSLPCQLALTVAEQKRSYKQSHLSQIHLPRLPHA